MIARLGLALELGAAFLVMQAVPWREVLSSGRYAFSDACGTTFDSLRDLRGAHGLCGLRRLFRAVKRVRRDPFGAQTRRVLDLASICWHFMGAVWIALFVALLLGLLSLAFGIVVGPRGRRYPRRP